MKTITWSGINPLEAARKALRVARYRALSRNYRAAAKALRSALRGSGSTLPDGLAMKGGKS